MVKLSVASAFAITMATSFAGAALLDGALNGAEVIARQAGGFSTQYWANDFADLDWESGPAGQFSVDWNQPPGGNFVVGKGYRPGGDLLFNYSGTFQVNQRAYLALYGWTTNPLVEYYVIESMGVHNPSDNSNATCHGVVESDGGTYEVWSKWRVNAPSIIGDATFQQYWSIRTKRHVGGTINTTAHFNAWKKAGLPLGRQNYMVISIEGQQGSGSANITAGVRPTTTVPESATPTIRTEVPIRTGTNYPCKVRL